MLLGAPVVSEQSVDDVLKAKLEELLLYVHNALSLLKNCFRISKLCCFSDARQWLWQLQFFVKFSLDSFLFSFLHQVISFCHFIIILFSGELVPLRTSFVSCSFCLRHRSSSSRYISVS
jgi:hypothetical protein